MKPNSPKSINACAHSPKVIPKERDLLPQISANAKTLEMTDKLTIIGARAGITKLLEKEKGVFVAVSDYLKALPELISRWVPGRLMPLGTDGFGRSETREALRNHFEVDSRWITVAVLYNLVKENKIKLTVLKKAFKELDIDQEKANPLFV